jgi:hypothetical protein
MTRLGLFAVSSSLLVALLSLPCVCAAAEYEEPTQYCHDLAEGAYQVAKARGNGLPDDTYNRVQDWCLDDAYRAYLAATPSVSLNELIAFDAENSDRFEPESVR